MAGDPRLERPMRHPFLKWAIRFALIVLLAVLVAGTVFWVRLPAIIEGQIVRRLASAGFPDSSLQVGSVGLHRLEVLNLLISEGSWQIRLREGVAHYEPLELFRPELRSVHLDGLRVDLDLEPVGPARGIALVDVAAWHRLAFEAPTRLPLRTLSIADGLFRLHRGQREVALPFEVSLVNDAAIQQLHVEARGSNAQGQVRLEGRVDSREGLRATGQFELSDDWNPWLTLVLPPQRPPPLDGLRLGPAQIMIELQSWPDIKDFEFHGSIPKLEAKTHDGAVILDETHYHARLRKDGTIDLMAATILRELRHANLQVSADAVSLAMPDRQTLEASLDHFHVEGSHGLEAKGDLKLAADQLGSWPDSHGAVDFHFRMLEFAGVRAQPFEGTIQGDPRWLEFNIPELGCEPVSGTTLLLTGLGGTIANALEPHMESSLTGHLRLSLSTNLGLPEPVAFRMSARRDPDSTSASLLVGFTNTPVLLPPHAQPVRITGMASTSATFLTNRSEWQMRIDLALGEGMFAGLGIRRADLGAQGTRVVAPSAVLPKAGVEIGWLEQRLPGVSPLLQNAAFDITLNAESVDLTNAWSISQLALHLNRSPSPDSTSALAQFAGRAASILCAEVLVTNAQGTGELMTDGAWFEGQAMLDTEPFDFRVNVAQTGSTGTAPELVGDFSLGPVRLDGFEAPPGLTGGRSVRISGEVDAKGKFQLTAGEHRHFQPSIGLDLERVEWLEQRLTLEGIRGALSGAWPGATEPPSTNRVLINRVGFRDYEATDLALLIAPLDHRVVQFELEDALLLDGHARMRPFLWDLRSGKLDAVLDLEQISLAKLASLFPRFAGSIEGELNGRLPIHLEAGQLTLGSTTLRLGRNRPARLRYPAGGLLTRGLRPDTDRHRQLKLVEKALQDLRLTEFSVDLYSPDHPQTPVRIRFEGTFTSAEAIIPVKLDLNINGDLDQVLRLLSLGELELNL
jgi:hypothetical protein